MATREQLRREVTAIVAEIADVPVDAIAPTSTFEQLDVDSLRGLRIVAEVERRYGIVIPEEKIGQIRSMQDIFALVDRYPAEG